MYSKSINIIGLILFMSATAVSANEVGWPLRISIQGKYLEDQNGTPFLIVGDTAWSLAGELDETEVITYLNDRQAKGFSAIIVSVIESSFSSNPPYNYDSAHPFTSGSNDWSIRNEEYWTHIDFILNEAKIRNIVVFLLPAYIGYQCGSEGWAQSILSHTTSAMTDYGEFLGNRYKDQGNIIWMHGGDTDCDVCSICNHVTAIYSGIATYDKSHLHTAHSESSRSAMDDYNSISDINTAYSYGSPDTEIQAEYSRYGAKPLVFIEGLYENEHSSTIGTLQSQAMTAYLGGALVGQFFGNCPIWPFGVPSSLCQLTNWEENLDSNGSKSVGHIGQLMRSRKWYDLVPDYSNNVVTNSKGAGLEYHATAKTTTGETIMVWCPNTNQVTVDMSKIIDAGSLAKSWWYDPDDNYATLVGIYQNSAEQTFTPPSDRLVLIIDSNSAALPAPGSAPTVAPPDDLPPNIPNDDPQPDTPQKRKK